MDNKLSQQTAKSIPEDISDGLEVFLYTNLSTIISPAPAVLLTPTFQTSLLVTLNDVGIRHNLGLAKDLKDILDIFVIDNASKISTGTRITITETM